MIDATRGSLRVRSWPKPRPGPRHPTNEFWTAWLKAATYLYRYQPASVQWELQQATKGTVYMPRDLFISAARGRAFLLQDELGRKYYPMAFRQDVSDSLDAIGQFPGMMLYRGENLWLPIQPGSPGTFLQYIDDASAPEWTATPNGQYLCIPILIGFGSEQTFNVNSTTYIGSDRRAVPIDMDEFPWTHWRLSVAGRSSAIGQTITCALRDLNDLNTPLGADPDDLVLTFGKTFQDSGWKERTVPKTGMETFGLCYKGSNSTVDILIDQCTVQLRVT